VSLGAGEQRGGSRVLGIRLFAAQVLAGYLTAALLNRLHPAPAAPVRSAQFTQTAPPRLDEVIAQAAVQYLKLCGFVLYFRMLAAGCGQFLPAAWAPFPAMLLEVCSGCDYAARTGLWASSLCCAALSVQGASVLLQVRERVDVPVTADHLIGARAAGAVNIMQVIAVQVCAAVFFFNVNELHGLLLFAGDSLAYHVLRRPTTKKIRAAPEAAAALIFFGGEERRGISDANGHHVPMTVAQLS